MNPLKRLDFFGQSVWLDDLRRSWISSGKLKRMIEEDGLQGITSNPAIFQKAISESRDYDEDIRSMALADNESEQIYEALTVADVQAAADEFWSLYDVSGGHAGFVSLEVNPHLAHRTGDTVEEARWLWRKLDRPNVFIKVPATLAGLPAIRQLISEGINVNVTLLFSLPRYRQVAEAYISGLEERANRGRPLGQVRSVASFFLSRIDLLVDELFATNRTNPALAQPLRGEVAIASAKIAYQIYLEITKSDRWKRLTQAGAQSQRLLWASTSAKTPGTSDVKYVEPLIGPDTVTTLPLETLKAYRDHGNPASRLEQDVDKAHSILRRLREAGIDIEKTAQQLEDEGVEKFNRPFDKLMQTLKERSAPFRQEVAELEQVKLS